MTAIFQTACRHELHADTDAEERSRFGDNRVDQRLDHAVQRMQPATAICERADAGQNHPICARYHIRVRRDSDRRFTHIFKRIRGRPQIARAIVDYGDRHVLAPSFL